MGCDRKQATKKGQSIACSIDTDQEALTGKSPQFAKFGSYIHVWIKMDHHHIYRFGQVRYLVGLLKPTFYVAPYRNREGFTFLGSSCRPVAVVICPQAKLYLHCTQRQPPKDKQPSFSKGYSRLHTEIYLKVGMTSRNGKKTCLECTSICF